MANTTSEGEARRAASGDGRGRSWFEALVADNLLVAVSLVLAIFLLAISRTLLGVDSWLTLVSGREIADHGLPHHEVLTTIPAGRTWTDQQWLAQLIYYGLFRAGGLGLAVVFHALMVTAALAITMIASRARGASSRMTLVAAIVCLVVAPWSWQLRAQSIALPLFALTLALISTDGRLVRRRTLLVFPTLILWANVHGSVLLGAMLVSLAGVFALVTARGKRTSASVWWVLAFLALPWACVFASPYGTGLVDYYRLLLVDSPVSRYITEWQAPKPHGYLLIFFAVAIATVVIAAWQRRRLSYYDLAVLALTLGGALRSVRAVVWFSLALAMLLPLALDGIVPPGLAAPVHRRLAAAVAGSLAALLGVVAIFTLTRSEAWFEHGWSQGGAKAAVMASGGSKTIWAGGSYGDWLLWKEPSLRGRIAWDARFELLTEAELRAIVIFNAHKPGWRAPARDYPVIVLDRGQNRAQARSYLRDPDLNAIHADQWAVVVARDIP